YYFVNKSVRQEFPENKMEELKKKGLKFHIGTHAMSGIERGLRLKKEAWLFVDLLAKMLGYHFSQGVKVCIEIASTICDAGLIPDLDRDIIAVGGTGRGADTVCLIRPAPTSDFKSLRVKAILAKPL
ncbi:MAG: pyruvate kinase alpha/beta domain-containing protein, partial [Promethearchaeota archaeon]